MSFSVIFAYNSVETIPAAGWMGPGAASGRLTINVAWVKDAKSIQRSVRHELIDQSIKRDMLGKGWDLQFKLGDGILSHGQTIGGTQYMGAEMTSFFESFFEASYRWAVWGRFQDPANSANDNLCECEPLVDDVEVSVQYSRETGYELVSQKTF